MRRVKARAALIIEDDKVRVSRFDFEPAAETGWHTHEFDYVITAISDCNMLLEEKNGSSREVFVPAGTAYRRSEGVQHNVINNSKKIMSFVEVELK